jgi:hypothetical protein
MFNFKSFCAAFALLSMFATTAAQAEGCDKVQVQATPFTHVVRSDVPARKMHAQMLAGRAFNTSEEGMALGMVVAAEAVSINVTRDDAGCRTFNVKAGFAPATVFVAEELKESNCGYRHIRNHEMEHVRTYVEFTSTLATTLSQKLSAVVSENSQSDNEAVAKLLYNAISEEFSKVYEKQHALDSNTEYTNNEKVCRGILMSIVKAV